MFFLAPLGLGLFLQALFLRQGPLGLDSPDTLGFLRLASGLEKDLPALLYRPRLFVHVLSLFGDLEALVLFQVLLKFAFAALVFRIARLASWSPPALGLVLLFFFASSLWCQAPLYVLDTVLFTFLLGVHLWCLLEFFCGHGWRFFAGACAAAGLTSATRQAADPFLLLGLLHALLFAFRRAGPPDRKTVLRAVLSLGLGLGLACSGALENFLRHGLWTRSVALGVNLYTHSSYHQLADPGHPEWAFVEARLPGEKERTGPWNTAPAAPIDWEANALPHRLQRALEAAGPDPSAALPHLSTVRPHPSAARPHPSAAARLASDRLLRDRFLAFVRREPRAYLKSVLVEAKRLLWHCQELYPDSFLALLAPEARKPLPPGLLRAERRLLHLPLGLLFLLAFLSFADRLSPGRAGNRSGDGLRQWRVLVTVFIFGYALFIAAVQVGFTRYALPLYPFAFLLAGFFFDAALRLFQRGFRKTALSARLLLPAAAGALLLLACTSEEGSTALGYRTHSIALRKTCEAGERYWMPAEEVVSYSATLVDGSSRRPVAVRYDLAQGFKLPCDAEDIGPGTRLVLRYR